MRQKNKITQLLKHWPKRQDFADEVSDILEMPGFVGVERVHKWARTGSIPAQFWCAVIKAAKQRSVVVTAQDLADWHSIPPPKLQGASLDAPDSSILSN